MSYGFKKSSMHQQAYNVNLGDQHDLEGHPGGEASLVPGSPGQEAEGWPEIVEYQEEFSEDRAGEDSGKFEEHTIGRRPEGANALWKTLQQNNVMSCTESPLTPTVSKSVSFRINPRNFLLEVQVRAWPGWLLVCHEGWNPALGTWICRHLGHLRLSHHKGVNLTDIKVNSSQEFLQFLPGSGGRLEDMWQHRHSCALGWVVSLKCSECGVQHLTSRIIGGTSAVLGQWPWQVSMFKGPQYLCGGSLLSPSWVVTAAHCVYSLPHMSSLRIFVGIVNRGDIVPHTGAMVEKIILHPLFKIHKQRHDYDIALLKLQTPLNFSNTVQAVCLPEMQQNFPQGSKCWVSGWGSTTSYVEYGSNTLQNALVPLISPELCNSSCTYKGMITPRMLCAGYLDGHTDACQGDSGGPLVCLDRGIWRLVGVVSWGWNCAKPHRPGVYTRVAVFSDWIHHQIRGKGTAAVDEEGGHLLAPLT
uniref:Transmembrane protease serine 5 n=1 Tax=Phascolarctos cinereus TaxID=38626 RepID=A0A6P5KKG5_PHACI|nr:transmembrane protease serine 5 [Phascolarctos cinereus]